MLSVTLRHWGIIQRRDENMQIDLLLSPPARLLSALHGSPGSSQTCLIEVKAHKSQTAGG